MITGHPPFKGVVENQIFNQILDLKYQIPKDMQDDPIFDLIKKLLQLDPLQRLGSGPDGSENGIEALKRHPFFKGIDFKNLHKRSPPIHKERMSIDFKQIKPSTAEEENASIKTNSSSI